MKFRDFEIKNRWKLASIRNEFYVETNYDERRKLIYMKVTNGISGIGSDDDGLTVKKYYIQKPNLIEKFLGITHESKIKRMRYRLQKICDDENKIVRKQNIKNYKKFGW